MKNISTASAHWEDTLENGFGTISAESSQIFTETPYNFKARSESQAHITTPEELLGAAHAACFSMAFSMVLGQKGLVATSIDTTVVKESCPVSKALSGVDIELEATLG